MSCAAQSLATSNSLVGVEWMSMKRVLAAQGRGEEVEKRRPEEESPEEEEEEGEGGDIEEEEGEKEEEGEICG